MTERYNPWTVVNLVFTHLAEEGLRPVLGEAGNPEEPAAALLRALGIEPGNPNEGSGQVAQESQRMLSEMREVWARGSAD